MIRAWQTIEFKVCVLCCHQFELNKRLHSHSQKAYEIRHCFPYECLPHFHCKNAFLFSFFDFFLRHLRLLSEHLCELYALGMSNYMWFRIHNRFDFFTLLIFIFCAFQICPLFRLHFASWCFAWPFFNFTNFRMDLYFPFIFSPRVAVDDTFNFKYYFS